MSARSAGTTMNNLALQLEPFADARQLDPSERLKILRVRVDRLLRHTAAFLLEGDFFAFMQGSIPNVVVRGEEKSPLDGGVSLKSNAIMGLEIKSLVQSLQKGNEKSGPFWHSRIHVQEGQRYADLFGIAFPLLRGADTFWAFDADVADDMTAADKTFYQFSAVGHQIDNVVPPHFWPKMMELSEAAKDLEKVHSGFSVTTAYQPIADHFRRSLLKPRFGQQTMAALEDKDDRTSKEMIDCIRQAFADHPTYKIGNTKYTPLTADFSITNAQGHCVFVEMKHTKCRLLTTTLGDDNEDKSTIRISHHAAHNPVSAPIFTYRSSRWTWLMTELLRHDGTKDRIIVNGVQMPRRMLLLHREVDIPQDVWHRYQGEEDFHHIMDVPRRCLVDFSADFVDQMTRLLNRIEYRPFRLPLLEDLASLTEDQLRLGVKSLTDDLVALERETDPMQPDSAAAPREVGGHRPQYVFQARASLQWLYRCRNARQGLVFDFEAAPSRQDLRAFAFTAYLWNRADLVYTSLHPKRLPRQLFQELPHDEYLLLSFAAIRFDTDHDKAYIAPFVINRLLSDFEEPDRHWHNHRLLILTSGPCPPITSAFQAYDPPFYLIPAVAIQLDRPKDERSHDTLRPNEGFRRQNHTRWQQLVLNTREPFHNYRFDDGEALLAFLASRCQRLSSFSPPARVGSYDLSTVSRQTLLQSI